MRIKLSLGLLFSILFFNICHADDKPPIHLVTTDWPPYVVQQGEDHGYIYKIVNLAFQKAGYQTVISFMPWKDAMDLKAHGNEAFFPAYERPDRTDLACSDSIYSGPIAFFKKKSSPIQFLTSPVDNELQALHDLQQYRFGIVEDYANTQTFDKATFLNKKAVISDYANLQQLQDGKVDLIIADVFVALNLMKKYSPAFDDIEMMSPSLEYKNVYLCFSNQALNYQDKLTAFNHSLNEMESSGQLNDIVAASGG